MKSQSLTDLPLVYDTSDSDVSGDDKCKYDLDQTHLVVQMVSRISSKSTVDLRASSWTSTASVSCQSTPSERTTSPVSRQSTKAFAHDLFSDRRLASMLDEGSPSPRGPRIGDQAAVIAYFADRPKSMEMKCRRRSRRRNTEPVVSLASLPLVIFDEEEETTPGIPVDGSEREASATLVVAPACLQNNVTPKDRPLIIFDWDDTLLPTWYLTEVVRHSLSNEEWHTTGIPGDSVFYESLVEHAQQIRNTLQAARNVARVAIVTLAERPWVHSSANKYLPNLDLDDLVERLKIPVYYAREHVPKWQIRPEEEGVSMFVVAKRNAMAHFVRRMNKKYKTICGNVISIGDSENERQALGEVMWSSNNESWCKVVKLACDPPVTQLMEKLQLISLYLRPMVAYAGDFDIDFEIVRTKHHMDEQLQLV